MSKRKTRPPTTVSTAKKLKPILPFNPLLPFEQSNRLKVYDTYDDVIKAANPIKADPTQSPYKDMITHYQTLSPQGKELANFIFDAVTNKLDQIPAKDKQNIFDKLYLLNKPYIYSGSRQDLYNNDLIKKGIKKGQGEQSITLSPTSPPKNPITTNPITALTHESTHALDDAYMRIYQKEIIDTLAAFEKAGIINGKKDIVIGKTGQMPKHTMLQDILENAQSILPIPNFSQRYKYKDTHDQISSSFSDLGTDKITKRKFYQNKPDQVDSFIESQKVLNDIRSRAHPKNAPGNAFFNAFSEFPAFGVESLFDPWIPSQNIHANELLRQVMQGVRRGFIGLGMDRKIHPQTYGALENKIKLLEPPISPLGQPQLNVPSSYSSSSSSSQPPVTFPSSSSSSSSSYPSLTTSMLSTLPPSLASSSSNSFAIPISSNDPSMTGNIHHFNKGGSVSKILRKKMLEYPYPSKVLLEMIRR